MSTFIDNKVPTAPRSIIGYETYDFAIPNVTPEEIRTLTMDYKDIEGNQRPSFTFTFGKIERS